MTRTSDGMEFVSFFISCDWRAILSVVNYSREGCWMILLLIGVAGVSFMFIVLFDIC